jgi:hypothetical protein
MNNNRRLYIIPNNLLNLPAIIHNLQCPLLNLINDGKLILGMNGDTLKVRIPNVDRARIDPRNCLAVIIAVQDDQFTIL